MLAAKGLDEERAIAAFLHAGQIGLFDMSWNVLCPSCSGVLDANTSLKSVRSEEYYCAFCNLNNEPTLDDMVEVSFTVNPRVRRIAAHNPDQLPLWEYYRQIFWGPASTCPRTASRQRCSRSPSTRSNCRPARRRSCRCNCRPTSSSCSSR